MKSLFHNRPQYWVREFQIDELLLMVVLASFILLVH
jgi:hypothetical protein